MALKFEQLRQKYLHNKDSTEFLEMAVDLFIFTDQLQRVSNMFEADRKILSCWHSLLVLGHLWDLQIQRLSEILLIESQVFWALLVFTYAFCLKLLFFSI